MYDRISLKGAEGKYIHKWLGEWMNTVRLKTKGTVQKHCTLTGKVVSHEGMG